MPEKNEGSSVFKVAFGVFLGVMAALLVYSVPGWIRTHEAEKREAEEASREIDVQEMQPRQFVAHCGLALNDKVTTLYGSTFRNMTIRDSSGNTFGLEFTDLANDPKHRNWFLESIDGVSPAKAFEQRMLPQCVFKEVGAERNYESPYEFTTPERFISQCGKPLKDESWHDGKSTYREMSFKGSSGRVTLEFRDILSDPKNADWSLESVDNLPMRDTLSTQEIQKLGPCISAGR